jgi:hypothetical protein
MAEYNYFLRSNAYFVTMISATIAKIGNLLNYDHKNHKMSQSTLADTMSEDFKSF